jgi:hypothetical protein
MQNEIHPSPHLAQSCTYFSPSRNLEHLILSDERSRSNCHLRYIRAKLLVPGLIYLPASASLAYLAHLFRINYACQTSSSAQARQRALPQGGQCRRPRHHAQNRQQVLRQRQHLVRHLHTHLHMCPMLTSKLNSSCITFSALGYGNVCIVVHHSLE